MSLPAADILVVDDNPNNLELLRTVLEVEGHRVHVELDGQSALAAIASMAFDIALIDIRMPLMSGYELCAKLKADPLTRNMPVIFLSALDDATDKVQAFESGGDDYIVKPFKVAEVMARVNNQLRNASMFRQTLAKNEELRQRNAQLARQAPSPSIPRTPGGSALSLVDQIGTEELFEGKFKLEGVIGRGGFGDVYQAKHMILDRPVAIKLLRSEQPITSKDAARFRLEGISACRVEHPNAVAVWDAGVTQAGAVYLVMELLTGHSLRTELAEKLKLPASRVVWIARAVADVLAAAHAAGVIHRDIKPDNIFLHKQRESIECVKVVDFGIAKLMDLSVAGSHTAQGQMIGTPDYLAPERLLSRPYDGRTDVYSLGCMMFELLAGRLPFIGNKQEPWMVATQHVGHDPPSLMNLCPDIPPEVAAVVHVMLEKRPGDRPFAAELVGALDKLAEIVPLSEPPQAAKPAPASGRVNTEAPTVIHSEQANGVRGAKSS